ncbi:LADA_0A06238g1_1 [Lachancea dasiensis]|uniref:LADA_0A06238g1_1 n=1 Tax=Lachancea dasiensis TaxID=1072105 RepID=A0A1G4IPY9_9SACH|nr:LADA_0A06238g1_1 [Lachancea dasiensis]
MINSLICLIVGETPATQFLAWRLSLSNAFIILVSSNISSDGLVAWKSSKLGSNFYRPNEFAKELDELQSKLVDSNGKLKYKIDIVVLSCLSIPALQRHCEVLAKYGDKDTVVLVDANFGVHLEKLVLDHFSNTCACTLSILCDVEGRQLSSGSYVLVNETCQFYIGLTYSHDDARSIGTQYEILRNNFEKVRNVLSDEQSTLNALLQQLQHTQVEAIITFTPDCSIEMALTVWEYIIPRISLNILSIVFERFDYDRLLANASTKLVFQDLVKDLINISFAHCGRVITKYMKMASEDCRAPIDLEADIDFEKIVEHTKIRKRQTDIFTVNEYPEYLTLSFEAYCFYHKLEFPADILLKQPILMANEFGIKYSSLNFLIRFYSQLLSLSGLCIEGGPRKLCPPSFMFGSRTQLNTKGEAVLPTKNDAGKKPIDSLHAKLKRGTKTDNNSVLATKDPDCSRMDYAAKNHDTDTHDTQGEQSISLREGNNSRFAFFCDREDGENTGPGENDSSSIVDTLIQLPNFRKRTPGGRAVGEVDASAALEREIRANPLTMASRYYFKPYHLDRKSIRSLTEKCGDHWDRPSLWKMQRQYLIERGQMTDPSDTLVTGSHRPLMEHIKLLKRLNMRGILSVTTSRYGHVDTSMRLFDNQNQGKDPLKKRSLTAPAAHRTLACFAPGTDCHSPSVLPDVD